MAVGGEEDGGDVGEVEEFLHELDTVGIWKKEVEEDEVGAVGLHEVEGLVGVAGDGGRVAGLGEGGANVAQRVGVVVDGEDAHSLRFVGRRERPMSVGSVRGSEKVKRAPRPGPSLSAQMRSPWDSTMPLQMARPRLERARSRRPLSPSMRGNFLKRSWMRSAGMPLPFSLTDRATWTPSQATLMRMVE